MAVAAQRLVQRAQSTQVTDPGLAQARKAIRAIALEQAWNQKSARARRREAIHHEMARHSAANRGSPERAEARRALRPYSSTNQEYHSRPAVCSIAGRRRRRPWR